MKKTALYDKHVALGARIVPFAGYEMPVSYSGISEEHKAVRSDVGMFDVSHMGEFIVKGKEALQLVQAVTSNNAAKLKIGQAQYSCLPNDDGGIVDDLLVYRLPEDNCAEGEQAFMLVVNASNIEKDWNRIESLNTFDTRLINISEQTGLIAVQGPKAVELLSNLTEYPLKDIEYYHFAKGQFAGCDNVIMSSTGYTGSGGMEIYADNADIGKIWDRIVEIGSDYNLQFCGLGSRDTLRLEMGYCLYGNDIDDETSPIEAGLSWIVKTKKGVEFPSMQTFIDQRKNGVDAKLCGFMMDDRRVPRKGYKIFNSEHEEIGVVTSGTMSPTLEVPIGMGYVNPAFTEEDTEIYVEFRNKKLKGLIKKLPFVNISGK